VGGSLVGGVGLFIADKVQRQYVPAFIIGVALLACSGALLTMPAPPKTKPQGLIKVFRELSLDIWSVVASRGGVFAVVLSIMPIGAGAASNLFAPMAEDWHASVGIVSFSNSVGSGIGAIAGCLVGGKISDGMNRRNAYALCGVLMAAFTFAMAMAPRTPHTYLFFVFLYNFGVGLCYATFAAFILEIIGKGAAATKYNLFASLANIPIYTMGRFDGYVSDLHGRKAMLWVDGGAGVVGALFVVLAAILLRVKPIPASPEAEAPALPDHA